MSVGDPSTHSPRDKYKLANHRHCVSQEAGGKCHPLDTRQEGPWVTLQSEPEDDAGSSDPFHSIARRWYRNRSCRDWLPQCYMLLEAGFM